MQGEADRQRELLDVESVAGHLLEPGSVFALLAEHRDRLFPGELFADLFPSKRGRPSIPGEVIASVIVLQALYGHSDREAIDALTYDLRWKAACGYAIDAKGFDPSTLTYWRRRLAASDRPQRIFEVVREVITETGAVAGKQRRALDSTILDDAVARQDTVTQLIAQIRRVGREVPGAKDLIATVCTRLATLTGQDYDQPGKPSIAWDDQAAREELVTALVGDALALLAGLDVEAITAEGGKAADAVALLALIAGQDVEPAEGSDGTDGRWRIARRTAPDRVISTVDPDTRHAHKSRERRQDGFKAHLVVEPDTGLSTVCELTKANGAGTSDASVGARLVTADLTISENNDENGNGIEVLGDSAYASGDMLDELNDNQWRPLLKPRPLRPAVEGGFTIDDFAHDTAAGTLTCPAGVTRQVTAKNYATFGTACRGCPLREQCTTSAAGRSIKIHEHAHLLREHRQRAADEGFQAAYRQHRPMVERSIAWLTRGARRVPYRGVEKNNNWLHHRVAALNLRRLVAMGLTNTNGTWVLA
ncbi:IS5 family transposase [Nocardioides massiliensis]|uniref:IS5 family transposase n=1 Tax=Nocardioides massiliensis TaxID=1325935 RepID=A0ABT9NUU0_9ACTN|nr:IS1182 family transposase [Nocardioides massiliensis]MDP9824042.1 IS5 family transposase [Nocardioides massiliensis]